jgi:hypothetical protein
MHRATPRRADAADAFALLLAHNAERAGGDATFNMMAERTMAG